MPHHVYVHSGCGSTATDQDFLAFFYGLRMRQNEGGSGERGEVCSQAVSRFLENVHQMRVFFDPPEEKKDMLSDATATTTCNLFYRVVVLQFQCFDT